MVFHLKFIVTWEQIKFESKLIGKLCEITGIKKTRKTPYHPLGIGLWKRFNKTLLYVFATLPETKEFDWTSNVSTLKHVYNAAVYDSSDLYKSDYTSTTTSKA